MPMRAYTTQISFGRHARTQPWGARSSCAAHEAQNATTITQATVLQSSYLAHAGMVCQHKPADLVTSLNVGRLS